MESRLIYESSQTFMSEIKWIRKDQSETEWKYFDLQNPDLIEKLINEFFITDTLNVSLGRHNSFTQEKNLIYTAVKSLIGKTAFKIWNEGFTKTIEINEIGVYRTGYASS